MMNVLEDLNASNIAYAARTTGTLATWRWPNAEDDPIPVLVEPAPAGYEPQHNHVLCAIGIVNTMLNRKLLRIGKRSDLARELIQVSFGNAYIADVSKDPCNYRANVAQSRGGGDKITPGEKGQFASTGVFMNIGNGLCEVHLEHVLHEFGHALGLAEHFEGFGDERVISPHFWNVLATLYGNAPGTALEDVKVVNAHLA